MYIHLTKFIKEQVTPITGKHLVKTESNFLKNIQYLQANVTSTWNEKKKIYEVSVDVHNQKVLEISTEPLIF